MEDGLKQNDEAICANCGRRQKDHYLVNYSDGVNSTGYTYICPASVFHKQAGMHAHTQESK